MMDEAKGIVRRVVWLAAVLGVLGAMVVGRGILGSLPHEPRLFLQNGSCRVLEGGAVRSSCGDLVVQEIDDEEVVRLDLVPRRGCTYNFRDKTYTGDELIGYLELARREKADVKIHIDLDYVDVDLTDMYKWL